MGIKSIEEDGHIAIVLVEGKYLRGTNKEAGQVMMVPVVSKKEIPDRVKDMRAKLLGLMEVKQHSND